MCWCRLRMRNCLRRWFISLKAIVRTWNSWWKETKVGKDLKISMLRNLVLFLNNISFKLSISTLINIAQFKNMSCIRPYRFWLIVSLSNKILLIRNLWSFRDLQVPPKKLLEDTLKTKRILNIKTPSKITLIVFQMNFLTRIWWPLT